MRSGAIRLMRDRLGWMMKPHHAYRTRRERQQLRWRIRDIWFYNSQKTVKKIRQLRITSMPTGNRNFFDIAQTPSYRTSSASHDYRYVWRWRHERSIFGTFL